MDQSQREFLIDIEDLIEQIFEGLNELREKHDDGRLRRELLDEVFRRVHSVKGLAASIGLDSLSDVAHEFELCIVRVWGAMALDDGGEAEACDRTNDGCVKHLAGEAETDESDVEHGQ